MNIEYIVEHRGSRNSLARCGIGSFPACFTGKLGNVDTRNVCVGVVLATLDRWGIEHREGEACLRRSQARDLRRALFGSRGIRSVPHEGQMVFELFDGMLYLDYESPRAGWTEASNVRLHVLKRRAVQ
jgi:hypothetical protein